MKVPQVSDELLERYDVAAPRYTSYPTVPAWEEDFGGYPEALTRASEVDAPLSLYVHLPFCHRLCHYCGCNVVVSKHPERTDAYLEDIEREIALVAARLRPRNRFSQLHLGGGTPTFSSPEQLRRLFGIIRKYFEDDAPEISVEVHPKFTTRAHFDVLAEMGVTRMSLGVQDLDPQVQEAIGRDQSREETHLALDLARGVGIRSINFDLIYGLPHQTTRSWARTLDEVVALRPDRIALYSFAWVPEQRPNQRRIRREDLPLGRTKLDLFRQAWAAFSHAGMSTLGMDHFAAPHDSLSLALHEGTLWRNFQGYTRRAAPDTVAFGVSAISDVAGTYAQNVRTLPPYRAALAEGRLPIVKGIRATPEDLKRRDLITSLMCRMQVDLGSGYQSERIALLPLIRDGLAELDGDLLRITELGRIFMRNVALVFDAHLGATAARFSRTV